MHIRINNSYSVVLSRHELNSTQRVFVSPFGVLFDQYLTVTGAVLQGADHIQLFDITGATQRCGPPLKENSDMSL